MFPQCCPEVRVSSGYLQSYACLVNHQEFLVNNQFDVKLYLFPWKHPYSDSDNVERVVFPKDADVFQWFLNGSAPCSLHNTLVQQNLTGLPELKPYILLKNFTL